MAKPIVFHNPKTLAYHESALVYNKAMAECARELVISDELTDKDVKRWCMSQAQQHEQHIPFHEKAVKRLREEEKEKQRQQNKQNKRGRGKPRNGPRPGNSVKREEPATESKSPARPIPRDPREPKKIYTDNPIERDAVETHTPLGDETQEAS